MKMRLLFLTAETCPTFRADVAVLFGKYLPRLGVYSDIVAGRTPGHDDRVLWGGGEAHLYDVSCGRVKYHIKTLLYGIKIMFSANRVYYQAIQVRDMPLLAAIGMLVTWLKCMPFYYWMSYPMPEGQIESARTRGLSAGIMKFIFPWVRGRVGCFLLYRIILPHAHHIFVQSERMKLDIIERGISAEKITPVPMGVDLEVMKLEDIPPSEDPRLNGRRVIVYLGTLDPPRHIEVLFEMLARVRQQIPEVMLILIGDTEDEFHRQWLKRQIVSSEVEGHVLWTGWLPIREGWRYVRAGEIGLSPFPRGFLLDSASPTKVPEYLVLGVPVVCNDNPDQEKLIRESKAGLCVDYTPSTFAEAVLQIFEYSPRERLLMASSGLAIIRSHRSYDEISMMVAQKYAQGINRAAPRCALRRIIADINNLITKK
jgi:glycosyltransferase involved in cell wall biosynthesis